MTSVFQDSESQPEERTIRAALGTNPDAWDQVTAALSELGAEVSWRYYRDGGWLAKATLGKKTIAWLAVEDGFVRVTVFFAERHRTMLGTLPGLPATTSGRIATTPLSGRLLPVTTEVRTRDDMRIAQVTLEAKLAAK